MRKATEICVGLDNSPGTLGRLCTALRKAKVNVEAISVLENSECCWVRMVVTPTATAKRVLTRGRYHFCTTTVLVVMAHNEPGQLAGITSRLGKAGVNIQYLYASNPPGDQHGSIVVVRVDDTAKGAKALGHGRKDHKA